MHFFLQPSYETQQSQKIIAESRASPLYNNGNSPSGGGGGGNYGGVIGGSRTQTPHNSLPRSNTPQQQGGGGGNLSELDSLLQDLSSARYGSNIGGQNGGGGGRGGGAVSPSQNMHSLNDSYKRPSVDSLLDELSNANNSGPIYAIPNG